MKLSTAVPSLVGPILGPLLGGLIVHYLRWSIVFLVNLPVGMIALYLVWRFLPDYRQHRTNPLDVAGLVLFGSGVALLSYVLEVFDDHRLGDLEILGLLGLSPAPASKCRSPSARCSCWPVTA